MFKLVFSTGDIARTRIVATYGPYSEALFSLGVMAGGCRTGAMFEGWRGQVRPRDTGWAGPLSRLMGREPKLDLFTLIGPVSGPVDST